MVSILNFTKNHTSGQHKIALVPISWIANFPDVGADGYLKSYIERIEDVPWQIEDNIDEDSLSVRESSKVKAGGHFLNNVIKYNISVSRANAEALLRSRKLHKYIAIITDNNGFVSVYGSVEEPLFFSWDKKRDSSPTGKNQYTISLTGASKNGPAYYWKDLLDFNHISNGNFDTNISGWSSSTGMTLTHDPATPIGGAGMKIETLAQWSKTTDNIASTTTAGKLYRTEIDIYVESGQWRWYARDASNNQGINSGSEVFGKNFTAFDFEAVASTNMYLQKNSVTSATNEVAYIDNVSVKEIVTSNPN